MVSAGLESPSESTTVSEGDENESGLVKTKKTWRYRGESKFSKKFTAADIQQREWENFKGMDIFVIRKYVEDFIQKFQNLNKIAK